MEKLSTPTAGSSPSSLMVRASRKSSACPHASITRRTSRVAAGASCSSTPETKVPWPAPVGRRPLGGFSSSPWQRRWMYRLVGALQAEQVHAEPLQRVGDLDAHVAVAQAGPDPVEVLLADQQLARAVVVVVRPVPGLGGVVDVLVWAVAWIGRGHGGSLQGAAWSLEVSAE